MYDERALARAAERYGDMLRERRSLAASRLAEVTARDARIGEIADEMRLAGLAAVRAAMEGTPEETRARVERVAAHNLELQRERGERLRTLGLPEDYLYSGPFCAECGDTGYRDGVPCACFLPFYTRALTEQFDEKAGHAGQNFRESLFLAADAGENRRDILARAHSYAQSLGRTGENLLIRGESGRGKTELAAYIARGAIARGVAVLYVSAPDFFTMQEDARFRRDDAAAEELARLRTAEVLILDDLGLEAPSSGAGAALLGLLNARETAGRPLILCTAQYPDALSRRYSAAVSSRLDHGFSLVELRGGDMRRVLSGN